MKSKLILLSSFFALFALLAIMVVRSNSVQPLTEQQLDNLSLSLKHFFDAKAPSNAAASSAKKPQQESPDDFIKLSSGEKWKRLPASGMASGRLQLNKQKPIEVAILRMPAKAPLRMILEVWKQKLGVDEKTQLKPNLLTSQSNQQWQLFHVENEHQASLIAAHKGAQQYTFLRMNMNTKLKASDRQVFEELVQTSEVIN